MLWSDLTVLGASRYPAVVMGPSKYKKKGKVELTLPFLRDHLIFNVFCVTCSGAAYAFRSDVQ